MTTATLTSKHPITLPKEVRDRLVLGKGDRVQFVSERDGSIRVAKLPQGVRSDGAARRRLKAAGASMTSAAIRRLAGQGARASVVRRSGR